MRLERWGERRILERERGRNRLRKIEMAVTRNR